MTDESPVMEWRNSPSLTEKNDHVPNVHCTDRVRTWEHHLRREKNILLAYRTIKSNKGSKTPGTDGKTITDIKKLSEEELVTEVQSKLENYRPEESQTETD
jgi:retron-type reverse transcriptase